MRRRSALGLYSVAAVWLGGAIFVNSYLNLQNFRSMCEKNPQATCVIKQLDCLDDAVSDIESGKKALTRYSNGKNSHHSPSTTESANYLSKSRKHLREIKLTEGLSLTDSGQNHLTVEGYIAEVELGIRNIPNNQDEESYTPQREQIDNADRKTQMEVAAARMQIPEDILSRRDNKRINYVALAIGAILGSVGMFGIGKYFITRKDDFRYY